MEWILRRRRRENDLILLNDPDSVELIPFSFREKLRSTCSYNVITMNFLPHDELFATACFNSTIAI